MADLDKIQLNNIRLDACPGHVFDVSNVELRPGFKVRCVVCGGLMSLTDANQYIRGYTAAGGDPCQVWAGWKEEGSELEIKCPQCLGKCYVEPFPNDYHDCDLCESTGYVTVSKVRTYLGIKGEC